MYELIPSKPPNTNAWDQKLNPKKELISRSYKEAVCDKHLRPIKTNKYKPRYSGNKRGSNASGITSEVKEQRRGTLKKGPAEVGKDKARLSKKATRYLNGQPNFKHIADEVQMPQRRHIMSDAEIPSIKPPDNKHRSVSAGKRVPPDLSPIPISQYPYLTPHEVRTQNVEYFNVPTSDSFPCADPLCIQQEAFAQFFIPSELALQAQLAYYFSPENLIKDTFLRRHFHPDHGGVSLRLLSDFHKVKSIIHDDINFLEYSIERHCSHFLELIHTPEPHARISNWRNWRLSKGQRP